MNDNNNNDEDDDFPFNGLFSPIEKIFADFDRFFSGTPFVFSIPTEEFNNENSQSSTNLRDEVLKQDDHYGDENLDSTIEQHGFDGAFPKTFSSTSMMTTMQRETTPSGKCVIEKKIQHSSNQNENTKTETITKVCGDKHHTTIKQDGKIIREYGNSTIDELNQIDSSPDGNDNDNQPIISGNRHSDFFKKLFS
ncbi:unnamed protein product [Adineta steineri]|uniref:Uncharacterized protein n=1 Tax=Adineta steineri TaxID=433720 RepID=A0A815JXP5_9BILA|nr:unnamed protein product [Adineta steineri]CAF1385869.1 unnamed protein product [Adineta steineri]CAF1460709.1 unnamed protein product [Adineta steineri]CAF3781936.1 unnamed protein product [Adineta steineri]CAF3877644.1 unnamed protein product [Adineta steineri]